MTCKPCRVTHHGTQYQVLKNGNVQRLENGVSTIEYEAYQPFAADVRAEVARQRRNRNARERSDVMRSLGLVKTPYGWE